MGPSSKWIDGICPGCTVEDAARRSLEARLGAVAHWLPLAAHLAEHDIEHVHRLRVSTRRAVAAIRLYRDWLPPKQFRWMKKRLKKTRRAAGNARDLDVLADRLAREWGDRAAPVLAIIAQRRSAVQPAIIEVAEQCRSQDQFVRKTSALVDGIRAPRDKKLSSSFEEWAYRQLHDAAAEFFEALPGNAADTAALHQFRIRSKALRYVVELLAPGLEPAIREEHYPIVEELQERLGRINDHVVARNQLIEWVRGTDSVERRDLLCDLACHENEEAKNRVAEFREWWTPSRIERLGGLAQNARIRRELATANPDETPA
jgi:CHAD domain-containing protein